MDSSSVLMVIFFLDGCSARNDLLLGSNGKLSMPESHRRGPKISSSYCDDKVNDHYPYFLTLNPSEILPNDLTPLKSNDHDRPNNPNQSQSPGHRYRSRQSSSHPRLPKTSPCPFTDPPPRPHLINPRSPNRTDRTRSSHPSLPTLSRLPTSRSGRRSGRSSGDGRDPSRFLIRLRWSCHLQVREPTLLIIIDHG